MGKVKKFLASIILISPLFVMLYCIFTNNILGSIGWILVVVLLGSHQLNTNEEYIT